MTVKVTNNGFSTLSAGITNSATTITLASGEGSRFPNPSSPDVFYATLIDTSNNLEIVKVTARSTDSLTVVRAQDNTSARAFSTGDRFELRPVAKLFEDIQAEARDLNGAELVLDADGDTSITADTDDRIDIRVGGTDVAYISSNSGQGALINRKTATPLIINGDMAIWQRGTALSSSSGSYACDRFWYAGTGATSQRSTDVPSGKGFIYSNKLTYGSADMAIGQPIELPATGKQGNLISGQTLTIAFYGKVDSGTEGIGLAINFRNGKFDSTDQQAFTISDNAVTLTTSWQRFTKTFTIPTVHANNIMAAFEINGISKTAYITGVQAEIGTFDSNSIPPFQFEDAGTNLRRCQRYFQTIPGAKEGGANPDGTAVNRVYWDFKVSMRATPTITQGSGAAAAGVQFTNTEGYGIYRDGGNTPNIGSNAKADAEL